MYCLKKKNVTEEFPFDEKTLVFKVMKKIFCLTNLDHPNNINLKCDPELAVELRERHNELTPGFHMNKKHWNTIALDGTLSDKVILNWIDHSYEMVVKGLPKKEKRKL